MLPLCCIVFDENKSKSYYFPHDGISIPLVPPNPNGSGLNNGVTAIGMQLIKFLKASSLYV